MLRPYLHLLRTPGLAVPLLASVLGALPIGMLELSVLLLVRLETGSFAEAGAMAGAIGVGNALGIIVQGALIDRHGQTIALIPAGLICMSSLVLLVLAVTDGSAPILVGALAFSAGASVPATPSCIRVLVGTIIADPDLRLTAYATISITFTLAGVVSPLVVSGLLLLSGPTVAVVVAGILAGSAGLSFALTGASRHWRPGVTPDRWRPRGWATAGMRTLLAGNLGSGVVAGLSNVAIPAVALAHGSPALAGLCFAVAAVGDLVGGVLYGARSWRMPLNRLLLWAITASCAGGAIIALVVGNIPALLVVLFINGAIGPAKGITMSALLDQVARKGAVTESYATMVSAGLLGASAGYAAGGSVVGSLDIHLVFLIAAVAMACVALYILCRLHTLEPAEKGAVRVHS